jgi:hypothetical protein
MAESCATILGPRETLRFRYGAVELRVSGGETSLELRFLVPEDHTVVVTGHPVRLDRGGEIVERPLSATPIRGRQDAVTLLAADSLAGATEKALFVRLPRTARRWVDVSGPRAAAYVVTLPPLVVDGRRVEVPPITFQRRRGFGFFLLNC